MTNQEKHQGIIGVFGDSFASPNVNGIDWPSILKTKYGHRVKNYARASTSLFWSYSVFKKNINEFTDAVFVITSPGRLYTDDENYFSIGTAAATENALKNKVYTPYCRKIYQAALDYFVYLDKEDFNFFVHEQIIQAIHQLAEQEQKNLIMVPAVPHNLRFPSQFEFPLSDVTRHEMLANFGKIIINIDTDLRACHMSAENNEVLAAKIDAVIRGQTDPVTLEGFTFPRYKKPWLYWEKRY